MVEHFQAAARELCALREQDPDQRIHVGEFGAIAPRWQVVAKELIEASRVAAVIDCHGLRAKYVALQFMEPVKSLKSEANHDLDH
jgi:hypothetical protein